LSVSIKRELKEVIDHDVNQSI